MGMRNNTNDAHVELVEKKTVDLLKDSFPEKIATMKGLFEQVSDQSKDNVLDEISEYDRKYYASIDDYFSELMKQVNESESIREFIDFERSLVKFGSIASKIIHDDLIGRVSTQNHSSLPAEKMNAEQIDEVLNYQAFNGFEKVSLEKIIKDTSLSYQQLVGVAKLSKVTALFEK